MLGKKILLVDDEPEILKALKIRLAAWGYDVLTADNGMEAVRLAREAAPDAIILDIMMPEWDGIETLKRIRRFNKKVPVFMLTAYASEEKMQDTGSLGISAFIVKGAGFDNASNLIRVALEGTV
jgi:DNA-binding response OmpR family regulator